MRPDKRDQLQLDLHLPRAQGAAQGGPGDPVRQLRLPRMLVERLRENKRKEEDERHVRRENGGGANLMTASAMSDFCFTCYDLFARDLWRQWRSLLYGFNVEFYRTILYDR